MRKGFVLMMMAAGAMAQEPPREFTNSVGMKFVQIDPGSFRMGSEDYGPVHDVSLSKGFYLQTTEVTQAQWQAVMGTDPSHFKGPDRPVEMVSWDDIQEFLGKLNAREKETRYRLPTEAEWEYACRAGGRERDQGRNQDGAWLVVNSDEETHPVGQKRPNGWGLYDMRGNVWEWVQDWRGDYSAERQVDPQGPPSGAARLNRGGAFYALQSVGTCSSRNQGAPKFRIDFIGFRCARTF